MGWVHALYDREAVANACVGAGNESQQVTIDARKRFRSFRHILPSLGPTTLPPSKRYGRKEKNHDGAPEFVSVLSPYLRRAVQQADWDGHKVALGYPFSYHQRIKLIPSRSAHVFVQPLVPDGALQNPAFILERLLQRDFRIVHCNAVSRAYRSIETQSLADDGFEVRERVKLLHSRRVGRTGT